MKKGDTTDIKSFHWCQRHIRLGDHRAKATGLIPGYGNSFPLIRQSNCLSKDT